MAIEIERKFLVTSTAYKKAAYNFYDMVQGYIAHEKGNSVRVRITNTEAVMTIKGPSDSKGMSRYEWNHQIPVEDAKELLKLSQGGVIEKRRYLVHSGPHVFEIDEFYGDNEGLVIAEVELQSENETFEKPSFVGKEVTGDRRYYNAYLTTNPYKSWTE
ncbi:MAG: CYTH domain-containing protein [Bacteroidaceae bacterium]|jgi:CYTH domain-containing protein|nr:CYTH domain-containing protein [Bacteroidaceae bacterium]MBO5932385.1 CYTH domain-containing protein [Bacteroidaceae bacterium]MBO5952113.1 CYTH domain-containing protein [Bacteroidaceae bacterium]